MRITSRIYSSNVPGDILRRIIPAIMSFPIALAFGVFFKWQSPNITFVATLRAMPDWLMYISPATAALAVPTAL